MQPLELIVFSITWLPYCDDVMRRNRRSVEHVSYDILEIEKTRCEDFLNLREHWVSRTPGAQVNMCHNDSRPPKPIEAFLQRLTADEHVD